MVACFGINAISLMVGVAFGICIVANFKDFFLKTNFLDKISF